MKNEKFNIVLDDYERRIIVNSLNQMRNRMTLLLTTYRKRKYNRKTERGKSNVMEAENE